MSLKGKNTGGEEQHSDEWRSKSHLTILAWKCRVRLASLIAEMIQDLTFVFQLYSNCY